MHDQPITTASPDPTAAEQQLILPTPVMPDTVITPTAVPQVQPAAAAELSAVVPAPAAAAPAVNQLPAAMPPMAAASVQPAGTQPAGMPAAAAPAPGIAPIPIPVPAAPAAVAPGLADDGDLIEKEWVGQVQHIVASTAQDPYLQQQQIARLKADYLQKRYGKVIKVDG